MLKKYTLKEYDEVVEEYDGGDLLSNGSEKNNVCEREKV